MTRERRSSPTTRGLPRRQYAEGDHTRFLVEFGVMPDWPSRRCAWCGFVESSHEGLFPSDDVWSCRVGVYRCFCGPRFIVDGYVAACDNCRGSVFSDHFKPSEWVGVPCLQPVDGCPIEVPRYGYGDDSRVAEAVHKVWAAMPDRDRTSIMEYLANDAREHDQGLPPVALGRLRIEVLPQWSIRGHVPTKNTACGHVIRLQAATTQRFGPSALAALVACEFAATSQYATGSVFIAKKAKLETEIREIVAAWGFQILDMIPGLLTRDEIQKCRRATKILTEHDLDKRLTKQEGVKELLEFFKS